MSSSLIPSAILVRLTRLYPDTKSWYGPYRRKDDGRAYCVRYTLEGKQTSVLVARLKLELKLRRRLVGQESVDHKDGNKRNDRTSNLRVLSLRINASEGAKRQNKSRKTKKRLKCPVCKTRFWCARYRLRLARTNNRRPTCSRKCSASLHWKHYV